MNLTQRPPRSPRVRLGGYVIPPFGGFVFIHGPTSETIEMFDKSFNPGALADAAE